jgi:hypothetical protein
MEESDSQPTAKTQHYYVDEAGDGTLFNRKKQIVLGTEGCSQFFLLGLLDVEEPDRLGEDIASLHTSVLSDAYLKKIPSMQAGDIGPADRPHGMKPNFVPDYVHHIPISLVSQAVNIDWHRLGLTSISPQHGRAAVAWHLDCLLTRMRT